MAETVKNALERDYLTGLYNRQALNDIWNSLGDDAAVHCIFLDIDNFKLVNDIYGHSKGDELLVLVARLLKSTFDRHIVVRMGGDEFVVLVNGKYDPDEFEKSLPGLQDGLQNNELDESVRNIISFSIGLILHQSVSDGLDEILRKCDEAMYYVKHSGKGKYVSYDIIRESIERRERIKNRAITIQNSDEIKLKFRPLIHLQTSDVYAAAACIQWDFPGLGTLDDDEFMPILKQYSIAPAFDRMIFKRLCGIRAGWSDGELRKLPVYVRLSGQFLLQSSSIEYIEGCMEEYNLPPDTVIICVDEADFIGKEAKMKGAVTELDSRGFSVMVDDFGSAASVRVLQQYPVKGIIMGRDFIEHLDDEVQGIIIKSMITMSRELHLAVIVKDIKSSMETAALSQYETQFGMGDFYGDPLDKASFAEYVKDKLFYTKNKLPDIFAFDDNLESSGGKFKAEYVGDKLTFAKGICDGVKAVVLPGGDRETNYISLPTELMYTHSYSVSMWINPSERLVWTSAFFMQYEEGFTSFIPKAGESGSIFRMKDDKEPNVWPDLFGPECIPESWTYVTATYDALTGISRLYINGIPTNVRKDMPALSGLSKFWIGGDVFQHSFAGRICEFELYHYVISKDEVREKFRSYTSRPGYEGPSIR